jgi:hypothetical protein
LRIVKGLNVKRLLSLAALTVMVGATALPAGAVNQTSNVTIDWNISPTAAITVATNYGGAGSLTPTQGLGAPTVWLDGTPGGTAEACTAPASETAGDVNFGSITPDSALTANTDCGYKNAVDIKVSTNSTNWTVGEGMTAALPAGATLCALGNNGVSFPVTMSGAAANVTSSTRTAASLTDNLTCAGAGELTIPGAVSSTNMASSTTAYPTGTNIGEDLEVLLTPASATGAKTVTMTVTLVAN